jgi:hypothetical protein
LKTVAEWAAMMEHDLAQHPECPRSGFRFVSNMIGVAAIAAHRTSLRSALTSKQVRRDSDRNLDRLAVSGSVMLFRNTITQLIEN